MPVAQPRPGRPTGSRGVWPVPGRLAVALCSLLLCQASASAGAQALPPPPPTPLADGNRRHAVTAVIAEGVPQALSIGAVPGRGTPIFEVGTLWKVTSATGAQSHLLGTLHIGMGTELGVPPQAWQVLREARRLVVEVTLDELDVERVQSFQQMPGGADWSRSWTRDEMSSLRQRLLAAGQPYGVPGRIKPWVLVNAMALGPELPAQSLDEVIIGRARMAGLPVQPLETVMEQFASFDCIDTQEHLHILRDALQTPSADFRSLNRATLKLYAQQKVADLMTLQAARFPRSAAARLADARLTQCAISDRNERFVEKLSTLLLEPGQFVAVGAAHLVGPTGLLARLHERGFRVERLGARAVARAP